MFLEVLIMMLLGSLCGSGIGWLLAMDIPSMVTAGGLYGFFCYTIWRIIADSTETAIERTVSEPEPLMPESALLAFVFPVCALVFVIIGTIVFAGAFAVAIWKRHRPA